MREGAEIWSIKAQTGPWEKYVEEMRVDFILLADRRRVNLKVKLASENR